MTAPTLDQIRADFPEFPIPEGMWNFVLTDEAGDTIEVLAGGQRSDSPYGACIRTDAEGVLLTREQTLTVAKALWPAADEDAKALDEIQYMLRHPEWGSGMLEDISQIIERTGRPTDTEYDDEGLPISTWDHH